MTMPPQNAATPAERRLDPRQRRVLGVLIEKAKTTPSGYPMSANAVVIGCNQKNNRDPVTAYDDFDVEKTLGELQALGVVKEIDWMGRVAKYKHLAYEWLSVTPVELAVLAELLLRGSQALGELRARAARMEPIADLAALKPIVEGLIERKLMVELTPPGRGQIVSHNLYMADELVGLRERHGTRTARREPETLVPEVTAVTMIAIDGMKSPGSEVATFHGSEHGANVSFFVGGFSTGQGPKRHRHPYEETFIVLDGEIALITDGTTRTVGGGTVVVIPKGTWHEFKVLSEASARMVNVHPVARMTTEWAD